MRTIGRICLVIGAAGMTAASALPATAADILSSRGYGRVDTAYVSPYAATDAYGGAYNAVVPLDDDGPYAAYDAPAPLGPYGYGYSRPWRRSGSYYSYGAGRANPSLSPNGWDQDNPRDQQLQGHN
jgi:hypothetical protein